MCNTTRTWQNSTPTADVEHARRLSGWETMYRFGCLSSPMGALRHSFSLQLVARSGKNAFLLTDDKVWNQSRLEKFIGRLVLGTTRPPTAVTHSNEQTSDEVQPAVPPTAVDLHRRSPSDRTTEQTLDGVQRAVPSTLPRVSTSPRQRPQYLNNYIWQ